MKEWRKKKSHLFLSAKRKKRRAPLEAIEYQKRRKHQRLGNELTGMENTLGVSTLSSLNKAASSAESDMNCIPLPRTPSPTMFQPESRQCSEILSKFQSPENEKVVLASEPVELYSDINAKGNTEYGIGNTETNTEVIENTDCDSLESATKFRESLQLSSSTVVESNHARDLNQSTHANSSPCNMESGFKCDEVIYEDEFSNVSNSPLIYSSEKETAQDHISEDQLGRRIVDFGHVFRQFQLLSVHEPFHCTLANMIITKELRRGLKTVFTLVCGMCGLKETLSTEDMNDSDTDINKLAVHAMLSTGGGFSQLEEIMSVMNIPTMAMKTYIKCHDETAAAYDDAALEAMISAGKKEVEIAVSEGRVDVDGVPLINVVADGAWAKRSYKTNYNSLSGIACIIGERTKEILFLGVRNKYCSICAWAQRHNTKARHHTCYRNWTGTSTGMETDIILEGFLSSMEMHGVKYARLIGDGDSSVYKKLLEASPYGPQFLIEKVECVNHIIRNITNKVKDTIKRIKCSNPDELRAKRILQSKEQNVIVSLRSAVLFRHKQADISPSSKSAELKSDILNITSHVFGEHLKCEERGYFKCNGRCDESENYVPLLKKLGYFQELQQILNVAVYHAKSLIHNVTTNDCEQFNSLVAKFVGGKRVNFCLRGSYEARSKGAAVSYNTKHDYHRVIHKKMMNNKSPGTHTKMYISKKKRSAETRKERKKSTTWKTSRRRLINCDPDQDYGPDVAILDMDDDELREKATNFLQTLKKNDAEIKELTSSTLGQSENHLWKLERRKRLTASSFGKIIKMKKNTPCANTVKSLLYSDFSGCKATKYGLSVEPRAKEEFSAKMGFRIENTGLHIDSELPFLGATPDGLVGEEAIIEIKCPYAAKDLSIEEAINLKKITFASIKDGELFLKDNHCYMYQVQGQLHITKRDKCYFVIWTQKDFKFQIIKRREEFWNEKMREPLIRFYMECLLPEIIDPRHVRNMKIERRQLL